MIEDVDNFNGESGRAERALDRSGLRPTSEAVFVQQRDAHVRGPGFRSAVEDAGTRLSGIDHVENVQTPLGARAR